MGRMITVMSTGFVQGGHGSGKGMQTYRAASSIRPYIMLLQETLNATLMRRENGWN